MSRRQYKKIFEPEFYCTCQVFSPDAKQETLIFRAEKTLHGRRVFCPSLIMIFLPDMSKALLHHTTVGLLLRQFVQSSYFSMIKL
jgi:hypothetical protein